MKEIINDLADLEISQPIAQETKELLKAEELLPESVAKPQSSPKPRKRREAPAVAVSAPIQIEERAKLVSEPTKRAPSVIIDDRRT